MTNLAERPSSPTFFSAIVDPPLGTGCWWLLLIAAAVYFPALTGKFVWDDAGFVVGNKLLDAPNALYLHWCTTQPADYWPMSYTVLWLIRQAFGLQVVPYHFADVALHAACAMLVWRIARRLELAAPWLIGLLFLVHPVNVEAVAWVFQIKTTLAGAFYFAALLCFIRSDQAGRDRWFWLASLGLFLLAMLSKSSPVMLPVVLLIYCWWRRGRLNGIDIARSIPFFAVSVILGLVGSYFQNKGILPDARIEHFSIPSRLGQMGQIAGFYFRAAVFPIGLEPIYPKWSVENVPPTFYLPSILIGGAIAALIWISHRLAQGRRRAIVRGALALLLYILATLFPALGMVKIVYFYVAWVADHYLYLALPAIVAAFVQAGAIWFDRTASARGTILSAAVCAAIVLAALSFRQTFFWRDSLSLWQRQVSESPGECQGQGFLAEVLRQNSPDALEHARIAERLAPDRGSTHARLGTIYAAMGNRDEAIAQFTLATQCRPPAIIAYVSLGELAAKAGNDADAAQHYRDAIAVARTYFHWPGYPPAEANLGQLYFRDGRVAEAIELFNSAIAQEPQMVEAQNNLGIALMSQHHYAEAIPHLREALRQRPGLTKTQALLDEAIARAGSGTGGP